MNIRVLVLSYQKHNHSIFPIIKMVIKLLKHTVLCLNRVAGVMNKTINQQESYPFEHNGWIT